MSSALKKGKPLKKKDGAKDDVNPCPRLRFSFYRTQGVITPDNEAEFGSIVTSQLPTVFRVNKCKPHWPVVVDQLNTRFGEYCKLRFDSPSTSIYEISFEDYGKIRELKKWCEFMNRCGRIGFQELASMIPPMLLEPKAGERCLDMCAAPGSKTVQAMLSQTTDLSAAHPDWPVGFVDVRKQQGMVWGNDKDAGRACLALARNVGKADNPGTLLTSLDANHLPPMLTSLPEGETNSDVAAWMTGLKVNDAPLLFDKILADVPCSGDGTLRKNQDIWRRWTVKDAMELHLVQFRILLRGLRMLKPGGRLVYSTCSLSPLEDEAVVAAALRWYHEDLYNLHARQVAARRALAEGKTLEECGFSAYPTDLELGNLAPISVVDPEELKYKSAEVPDWLKWTPGMTTWKVPLVPPRKSRKQREEEEAARAAAGEPEPEKKGPIFFGGGLKYVEGDLIDGTFVEADIASQRAGIRLHPRSSKAAIRYALDDKTAHNFIRASMLPPIDVEKDPLFWKRFEEEHSALLASGEAVFGEGEKSLPDVRKRDARLLASMPQIFRNLETTIVESLPRTMRLLPQDNNCGGFYVAVFEKASNPLSLASKEEEDELVEHVTTRSALRKEAFDRVCALREAEKALKDQLEKDNEEEENCIDEENEEEDEEMDAETKAAMEGADTTDAALEAALLQATEETAATVLEEENGDESKRPKLGEGKKEVLVRGTPVIDPSELKPVVGCPETAVRLRDTFLMQSHSMQRRRSTFLTWRFDVFPPALSKRLDSYQVTTSDQFRLPLGEDTPVNATTGLPELAAHPQVQLLREFFGFSEESLKIETVRIASAPANASETALESNKHVQMLRLGGLPLLSYVDYRGDLCRIFATTPEVENVLLTSLHLTSPGCPVPALLQTGVRLFEHLGSLIADLPLRFRVAQTGAQLIAATASKRRVWVTREFGEKILKDRRVELADLLAAEVAGQVRGAAAITGQLGPVVVGVLMSPLEFLPEDLSSIVKEDASEAVWLSCVLFKNCISAYTDKEQTAGIIEVIAQQREMEKQ